MARASNFRKFKWKLLPSALNAWLLCVALPALAQPGTTVSGEAHGVVNHENQQFFETVFPILNYVSGFAVAGVLIFGGIWMLQRKQAEDAMLDQANKDAEAAEAAEKAAVTEANAAGDVVAASTTGSADNVTTESTEAQASESTATASDEAKS